MSIKQFIFKTHLILGLITGLILFIVAITGAMLSFKTEIESVSQPFRKVVPENRAIIQPSAALKIGHEIKSNKEIHGVIYRTPDEAIEIIYYQPEPLYYGAAYLNPYSGEVLKTKDFYRSFFGFAIRGHTALWLPPKIGTPVVAVSTILFLIVFISGIVLWWPINKGMAKSYSFSKKALPRVKIIEWHKVIGFYVCWLALILIFTGMTWLFRDFDKAVYRAMGGKMETHFSLPPSDIKNKQQTVIAGEPIDTLFNQIKSQYPEMPFIEIHALHDSVSTFLVELNRDPSRYWKMDYLYFDCNTLKPVEPNHVYGRFDQSGIPEKIKRMYYDIHTGAIGGLPGKIIMFLVSLFCASLPITGFILWWNRKQQQIALKRRMELEEEE